MPTLKVHRMFPNNLEEVIPTPEELEILRAYNSGDPEYQPTISQDELLEELGLQALKDTWSKDLPEWDETAAIQKGRADRAEHGTVSHDVINWD